MATVDSQGKTTVEFVRWDVRTPVVARIEPISNKTHVAEIVLSAVLGLDSINPTNKTTATSTISDIWSTHPEATQGLFVVDYAPTTSMLSIYYLPPFAAFHNSSPTRYKKGISTPTVAMIGNSTVGTLHADLVDPETFAHIHERDRAEFLVDYLESREWFVNMLNHAPDGKAREGYTLEHSLKPEGTLITHTGPAQKGPLLKFVTEATVPAATPALATTAAATPVPSLASLPTLLVEGLAAPLTVCTCGLLSVQQSGGQYVVANDVVIKLYYCDQSSN